jgi:hypothetical protein
MDFTTFQSQTYSADFLAAIEDLLPSLKSASDAESSAALDMVVAMERSIDVMLRASADYHSAKDAALQVSDISQIGDYALTLLDELSTVAANRGLQHTMLSLHRLSIPIAVWIADHGGEIAKLDVVVNAVASYANELTDVKQLAALSEAIRKVIFSVTADIKRDVEVSNAVRPWLILNLNWGIVATRCHSVKIMELAFDQLIKNIPADAQQFFSEGMKQMELINYPEHVKIVMEKYNNMFVDENLH